ncbi:MAG TPA: preprotein translocase subunit SecG [Thermoanaerobaculia bacterium]|nr:preprotein translocase subunit SecG [Thermoanaerobaculia bacterium]
MIYLFYAVHIVVCIFLILVVLLQQGKGADLSVFGGGSTQTAFGARSATTLLHKLTVTSFVLFICTTLLIGILQGGAGGSSIMSEVEETATGETETAPEEVDPATPETGPLGGEAEAPLEVEAEGEPPAGEDGDGR